MSFIPPDFAVPRHLETPAFHLEVLAPAHAQADYEAVCRSAARIRHVFGPDNGWPDEALRFEENLADLTRHEDEFRRRVAFAYAMRSPCGAHYLGCVYLKPIKSRLAVDARRDRFQAQAFFWLAEHAAPLDEVQVQATLADWLRDAWPWRAVAFPGRVQTWQDWAALATAAPGTAGCNGASS
jgi:hypothetical protein